MTKKNSEWSAHPFAPLNPEGLAPPGLTDEHLASAYRSYRKDLRPKKILKLLGVNNWDKATRSELRREMGNPQSRLGHGRDGNATEVPPLFSALYGWLTKQQWATNAYEAIVEPAEVTADDKVFLHAEKFRTQVTEHEDSLIIDDASPDRLPGPSSPEALALFALAYALLQPNDAEAIVTSLTRLGTGFERFFGLDRASLHGAADESPASQQQDPRPHTEAQFSEDPAWAAADHRKLHEELQTLQLEIQNLGQAFIEAGTKMTEQAELPSEDILTAFAALQKRLESLRNTTKGLFNASGLRNDVPLGEAGQTDALREALHSLERHHDRSATVAEVIDKVLRLRHRDPVNNAALRSCWSDAAELQHALTSGNPDPRLIAVAAGTHSLVQLLRLVEDPDALADEDFERHRMTLADAYGSKLARAVIRGSIRVAPIKEHVARTDPKPKDSTELDARAAATKSVEHAGGDETTTGRPIVATADGTQDPLLDDRRQPMEPENSDDQVETPAERENPASAAASIETARSTSKPTDGQDQLSHTDPIDELLQLFAPAWELVEASRLSLAFQLARTLELLYPATPPYLPSDVVRVAMLSPLVQSSTGPLTDAVQVSLRRLAENLQHIKILPEPVRTPLEMMTVCSSLRPALLAPATDAVSIVASVTVPEGLRQLQKAVIRHAELGLEMTPSVLKGVREHAEWDKLTADHCTAVGRWLLQNRQAQIIYAPTTKIWRTWLASTGSLGAALEAVGGDDRSAVAFVKATADEWSVASHIDDQVTKTDRSLRGRLAGLRPITARALTGIRTHAKQAVELMVGWLTLLDGKPVEGGFRLRQADKCRSDILAALDPAGRNVDGLLNKTGDSVYARAAHAVVTNTLAGLRGLFDPTVTETVPPPQADIVCGIDLLRVPGVSVNSDWEPLLGRTPALLHALTATAGSPDSDWTDVLAMKTKEHDHLSTRKILDLLETSGVVTDDQLAALRSQRDRELRQCIAWFKTDVDTVRAQIVRTASYDVLPEPTFLELKDRIDSIRPEQTLDFQQAQRGLAEVREQLKEYDAAWVRNVRERLRTELPDAAADVKDRIMTALSQGNVAAANEYIDFAIEGRTVDIEEEEDVFVSFFPGFVREINTFLGGDRRTPSAAHINAIRGNKLLGPVDMRRVPGAQAADAAHMLESWFNAKGRKGRPDVTGHLTSIFEAIGFESVLISGGTLTRADRWRAN